MIKTLFISTNNHNRYLEILNHNTLPANGLELESVFHSIPRYIIYYYT